MANIADIYERMNQYDYKPRRQNQDYIVRDNLTLQEMDEKADAYETPGQMEEQPYLENGYYINNDGELVNVMPEDEYKFLNPNMKQSNEEENNNIRIQPTTIPTGTRARTGDIIQNLPIENILPGIPEDQVSITPTQRISNQSTTSGRNMSDISNFNNNIQRRNIPYFTQSLHESELNEPTLRLNDVNSTRDSSRRAILQPRTPRVLITPTEIIESESPARSYHNPYLQYPQQQQISKSSHIQPNNDNLNTKPVSVKSPSRSSEDSDLNLDLSNVKFTPQGDGQNIVSTQIQDNSVIQPSQLQLDLSRPRRKRTQRDDEKEDPNQLQIDTPRSTASYERQPRDKRRRIHSPQSQQIQQRMNTESRQSQNNNNNNNNNNNSKVLLLQANNVMNSYECIKRARRFNNYRSKYK